MKNSRVKKLIAFVFIIFLGIGFAALSSTININGVANVKYNFWDVYFDNIQVNSDSASKAFPTITDKTTVECSIELETPGDFYEFTVDAVNDGTIDAMIDSIEMTQFNEDVLKLFDYTVSYENGDEINKNDILEGLSKTTYKIYIKYRDDINISDLNNVDIDLNLSFTVNYVQSSVRVVRYINNWEFDYTGGEQIFTVPYSGTYQLEVWGAQGGGTYQTYIGGYGGYSLGKISLEKKDKIYINVGGKGQTCSNGNEYNGGYNGGGGCGYYGSNETSYNGAGGGATHIATQSGLLSSLENNKNSILIVAGGGGGGSYNTGNSNYRGIGGSGGGYQGNDAPSYTSASFYGKGGTQTAGGSKDTHSITTSGVFGSAGKITSNGSSNTSGGGGGFYGGGSSTGPSGGGSGYIGNTNLTEKLMYCYNCTESTDTNTKTVSTTNTSEEPIANYAKIGNGYVRITYLVN